MNDYGHGLIGSVFPVRREERDVPRRILKILGRRFGLFVIPTRAGMTMNAKPSKLFQHMLGGRDLIIARRFDIQFLNHAILDDRSEEHTSELQSLMRISYAVFCLQKKQQHI